MNNITEDQKEIDKIKEQLQNIEKESKMASSKLNEESMTPEVVHSWQRSIEDIVTGLQEIASGALEFFTKKAERDERIEMNRMNIDYKAFVHRYWASLILCVVSIISLVIFAITNTGQNLNVVLGMIIGSTITFITKDASIITKSQASKKNKLDDTN